MYKNSYTVNYQAKGVHLVILSILFAKTKNTIDIDSLVL